MSKTQKIINKCPHAVYLLNDDGTILRVFAKSNGMIRVSKKDEDIGFIDGIPISRTEWGKTTSVPEEVIGTFYIVSQLVKNALPKRKDLLVPKGAVRDDKGNVIGCTRLDIGEHKEIN